MSFTLGPWADMKRSGVKLVGPPLGPRWKQPRTEPPFGSGAKLLMATKSPPRLGRPPTN